MGEDWIRTGDSPNCSYNYDAFLWNGTNGMTDLGALVSGGQSHAYGINDAGEVVGWDVMSSGPYHAFLWSGGVMTDLNALLSPSSSGWVLEEANGINDHGQIAGFGTINGQIHGFLATPTPELSSVALLLVGALPLGLAW